jgi:NADH:ubiquinone oxidoreductase subunit 3 (subunit A)
MSPAWAAMAVNLVLVLAIALGMSNAGRWLGPRPAHEGDGDLPYETGERPIQPAEDRMAVLYHRFAVLFVVFDADLAFLLPWALNRRGLDAGQLAAVTVFAGLTALMLAYLWRKGALECR